MAIKFLEGFETRQDGTYYTRLYESLSGAFSAFGTQRKAGNACGTATNLAITTRPLVDPVENTWTVGFGFKQNASGTPSMTICDAAGVAQLALVSAAGTTANSFTLAIKRGSTTLATTAELQMGVWHYFELQATIRTGINGSYHLKNNEQTLLSASGVNTADTGADGASVFLFNWGSSVGMSYDDIYILDSTGTTNNDFLGDQVVLGILPTTEGFENDWVPSTGSDNAAMVDDPANGANADYISSNVDTDVDLFEFSNLTDMADDGVVNGLVVFLCAAMLSSGGRELKVRVRSSGGSTADSASVETSSKTTSTFVIPYDEDPVAVAAWTKTALEGSQIGVHNIAEV